MTLAWRRRARPLLGTLVEMTVRCDSDAELVRLTEPAFARVRQFHAAMSRHEATSDVSRIGAAVAGATVAIAADTWQVLSFALALERGSNGLFDVAVTAAPSASGASAGASLRLAPDGRALTVLAPVHLDLGGVAKGAAVDAALATLRAGGAVHAIVNAGGDLAVLGDVPQAITVRGPNGWRVDAGTLADGAIATSGPFDTGSGSALSLPVNACARWADRTVSVLAPRCVVADALTKVVAILGQAAAPLLARHGAVAFSVDRRGIVENVTSADARDGGEKASTATATVSA